jgi:hypothetical protein
MKKSILSTCVLSAICLSAQAGLFFGDNFATFANGDLVGQNGWSQFAASVTGPLQVSGGAVVIPAGQTTDNQDAIRNFGVTVSPPVAGTTPLFFGFQVNFSAASSAASPSYLAALYDGSSFLNYRVTAKDNGAGKYVIGARPTGQGGYPWTFGSVGLDYNTTHAVIVEADLVAGGSNDVVKVFIDPTSGDLSAQTPYLTGTWNGVGSVGDPATLTGMIISQFGNSTTPSAAAWSIFKVAAGDAFGDVFVAVPEPSAISLIAVGGAFVGWAIRRRAR